MDKLPSFETLLFRHKLKLDRMRLETLQVNLGKLCNQACRHCHVEASPKRTEIMPLGTIQKLLQLIEKSPQIRTVDVTGGAPELNPHFRYFITELKNRGKHIINRCNLTVFFEKNQENTPQFLANHNVEITASLPCYSIKNVDRQRGQGVFNKSLRALEVLNGLGYGGSNNPLKLNLTYNPIGPQLPPPQVQLEKDYKDKLARDFGILFNNLYTISNMPMGRFGKQLERENRLQEYMNLLVSYFNPDAAKHVMCRNLISISWDGRIYDCDFNQMIHLPAGKNHFNIWDISSLELFNSGTIAFEKHCFGCTAGSGSSCTGITHQPIVEEEQ